MANIADQKNWIRKGRIDEIKKILKKLDKKELSVFSDRNFILQISEKYNVTIRKAKEYLEVARVKKL